LVIDNTKVVIAKPASPNGAGFAGFHEELRADPSVGALTPDPSMRSPLVSRRPTVRRTAQLTERACPAGVTTPALVSITTNCLDLEKFFGEA
jgi:hypothetical protein